MATGKQRLTFISYSRDDKDFALELAKELKASGFNIWLDQLDIPTGSRWDDEVERALLACDIFMIILTPNSISSNNVKDEIGYAIDSNKRILPVLLENANVPFRLRRFQYVDFTNKSTNEGIDLARQLLQKLVEEPTGPNPAIPQIPNEPVHDHGADANPVARHKAEAIRRAREQEQLQRTAEVPSQSQAYQPPPAQRQTSKQPGSQVMYLMIGIAILLLLCLGGGWIAWLFVFPPSPVTTTPPTATIQPVDPTVSTSPTATLVFTSSPVPTFTPAGTPTVTPFAPQEPDQFLNFYFDTIIYQRNFELGWSLLTEAFKATNNPEGFDDWKNTWGKVNEWTRPAWSVRYATSTKAYVSASEIWFRGTSWYTLTDREYCVVRDESRNTWIIEAKVVCDQ